MEIKQETGSYQFESYNKSNLDQIESNSATGVAFDSDDNVAFSTKPSLIGGGLNVGFKNASNNNDGNNLSLRLGLGIGLGVGVPFSTILLWRGYTLYSNKTGKKFIFK